MEIREISSSLPSLLLVEEAVLKKGEERSYFFFSVAPSLCLVIYCLTDLNTALVGSQEPSKHQDELKARVAGP